ncbi:MAG: hypothetical protein ACRDSR_04565 [Pseudonocardiaceae bacterium]
MITGRTPAGWADPGPPWVAAVAAGERDILTGSHFRDVSRD